MSRRRLVRRAVAGAAGLLAALPGAALADAAHSGTDVDLRGCLLNVHVLPDSQQRMAEYVPAGYQFSGWTELGGGSALNDPLPAATPTRAQPMLFAVNCRQARIGDTTQPTIMTLAGVAVRRRDVGPDPRPSYANNEHHVYLHRAHTDNLGLAGMLTAAGLPASHVAGMSFSRTPSDLGVPGRPAMHASAAEVPWTHDSRNAAFGMRVETPRVPNNFGEHDHDNSFWHGPADDAAELRLQFTQTVEHYICRQMPHCNRAWAVPGSPMAAFLGASERRDGVTFDHEEIAEGALTIVPAAGSGA